MPEVWLRNNRRALVVGMFLPGLFLLAALTGLAYSLWSGQPWWVAALAAALCLPPLWLIGSLAYTMTRPRVAYESGELLVFMDSTRPTRVPIDIVEVFFIGQGPSELPKLKGREPETSNVIIRLAESAEDWKHRDVRSALGQWCEGYITLRGSWCEPLTRDVLQKLNHRLIEVQRERRAAMKQEATT